MHTCTSICFAPVYNIIEANGKNLSDASMIHSSVSLTWTGLFRNIPDELFQAVRDHDYTNIICVLVCVQYFFHRGWSSNKWIEQLDDISTILSATEAFMPLNNFCALLATTGRH